jgi:zinc-binding alcohol dehydrogenase family protein
VGAAGGVGSVLIQLARQLTQLTVVATASRPQSVAWVQGLGAHHVIDHHQAVLPQLQAVGLKGVHHVASLTHTAEHYEQLIEALHPQGQLAVIDDFVGVDVMKLKNKSLSLHWELMFTRSLHATHDMAEQGRILERMAQLVDAGTVRSTLAEHYGVLNATHLRRAHALIESHQSRGKIVLTLP